MKGIEKEGADFTVVIPAAGSSRRMGGVDKLLINLEGKPAIVRTLETFCASPRISKIILVTLKEKFIILEKLMKKFFTNKVIEIVEGGKRRQDSVYNGILRANTRYVMIHDGARPLLTKKLLQRLMAEVKGEIGCVPVIPVSDTIKIVDKDGFIIRTPSREDLFQVQTPQIFLRELFIEAYQQVLKRGIIVTDESSVMEQSNYKIKTIPGSPDNIKLTTPEDVDIARIFLRKRERVLNAMSDSSE